MKSYKAFLSIMLIGIMCLSGCKFKREIAVDEVDVQKDKDVVSTEEEMNPVTIHVEYGEPMDLDALVQYFYGVSADELVETGNASVSETSYRSEKDGIEFTYIYPGELNTPFFQLLDEREGAGSCYSNLLIYNFLGNELSNRFLELFPEGELEQCSVDEVMDICAPLAEACGYGDAQVTVRAMNLNVLQEAATIFMSNDYRSAPDPNYNYISYADIAKAYEDGDDELASKLRDEKNAPTSSGIAWSKKDEAYLLIYRSRINGLMLESVMHQMMCIYVPEYERVVYVNAEQVLYAKDSENTTELITEEEALAEAIRVLDIKSMDDITVTNMSLVYSPRYAQVSLDVQDKIVNPCWRIDYVIDPDKITEAQKMNDDGTILINAVDGQENSYFSY